MKSRLKVEARDLAKEIAPIIAGKKLDVILRAFELLKQVLIDRALGGKQ